MPDTRVQDEQGNIHVFPDEATPEMIAQALGVKPPATPQATQPQQPSTYQKLTSPITPDLDEFAQKHPILGMPARIASGAGAAVIGAPEGIYNAVRHPIDTAKGIGQSIAAWGDKNTWKGAPSVLPEALGIGAGSYVAGEGVKAIPPFLKKAGQAVADTNAGQAISEVTAPARNATAKVLRNPATARQSQMGRPGTVKDILPPQIQKWGVPPWVIPKGDVGTPTNPGPFMDIPARMPKVAAPEPELGTAENPGFMSKLPTGRNSMPKPPAPAPIAEAQSAEGVPGSLPKPSGRLVLLPEEASAMDQMQTIAKRRASEHGLQYAAGMRPAGGGRVPMTPTKTNTVEFPQRSNPSSAIEMDASGTRWGIASDGTRVSIPKEIPDEGVAAYLQQQAALPWMRRAQQ